MDNEELRKALIKYMKKASVEDVDTGRIDGKTEAVVPLEDVISVIEVCFKEKMGG